MINVTPFIEKLEKLKEFMALSIDGDAGRVVYVDIDQIPRLSPGEVLDMFDSMGIMMYQSKPALAPQKLSFAEWLNKKQKQ